MWVVKILNILYYSSHSLTGTVLISVEMLAVVPKLLIRDYIPNFLLYSLVFQSTNLVFNYCFLVSG